MSQSINDITIEAIRRANSKGIAKAMRYIDEAIPLPDCASKRQQVEWKREQVKTNLQAAMRETKVTGPTLYK